MHPDSIIDARLYRPFADRLVIENLDARKADGRSVAELERCFASLPEARFCLDVAHSASIKDQPGLDLALLERFSAQLSHVHISSLDAELHHIPLQPEDEERFAAALSRCREVPWILESAPVAGP